MADMGEARDTARNAVVRPLSRVAGRPCARPGCPSPARATLSFRYATREAWLEKLADESSPATYDLCGSHADRTRPPTGWGIVDQRPAEDLEPPERAPARELGDEHTVAVLAAALRSVPERAVAPAPATQVEPEPAAAPQLCKDPDEEPHEELDDAAVAAALDDLDLPDDTRAGIEDALAELAAVARGDVDGAQQIAIQLDDDDAAPAAAPAAASDPADKPVPRPVRAARERAGDDLPGGPARAW